jgi:hypothetical protein
MKVEIRTYRHSETYECENATVHVSAHESDLGNRINWIAIIGDELCVAIDKWPEVIEQEPCGSIWIGHTPFGGKVLYEATKVGST